LPCRKGNKCINYSAGLLLRICMNKKLRSDISANSLQMILNQLSGLVIFYVLSAGLSKELFGEINWSLAVLLTVFSILSFGMDQVLVKKIAAQENVTAVLAAYSMHVVIWGLLMYGLLLVCSVLFRDFFTTHHFVLFIGLGKLLLFFSSPFKQLANGMEQFKPLLFMNTCSNIIRAAALIVVAASNKLNSTSVIIIFITGDAAEFLLSLLITKYRLQFPVTGKWNTAVYGRLFKESLPQMGVVLFTSAISRFDWIFLGLFSSTVILANYSFAYKVFEVATLPLLVIAPILIPRFTRLFNQKTDEALKQSGRLFALLRFEIIIACAVALLLNSVWVPVIDFVTQNKYGAVNKYTILLLSASMPFLYFNNFLWTISFAKGDLKKILRIFFYCFLVNSIGIIAAVPFFKAEGAAAAYLLSIIIQSVLFYLYHRRAYKLVYNTGGLFTILLCAAVAGTVSLLFFSNYWFICGSALLLYIALLILTGQLTKNDRNMLKQLAEI
jgi:O-antigen/teichoic acid export membrane protein